MSSSASLDFGPAVVVSVKSTVLAVAQIVIICISGFVLAYTGFLTKKHQKFLNNMNMKLFTPALIFSKIALSLSPSKLVSIAIVPAAFVFFTAVSAALAWATATVFRLRQSRRRFVICCAMAVNSNSLPIALIQALSAAVPALKSSDDDTADEMLARGISYLVLYSTLGLVWRWSFMVSYLEKADSASDAPSDPEGEAKPPVVMDPQASSSSTPTPELGDLTLSPTPTMHPTPVMTRANSATDIATLARWKPGLSVANSAAPTLVAPPPRWRRILRKARELLTPPTYAAILAILVAAIQPVQHALQKATPITGAVDMVANIAVPLTLVVLGAYFSPDKDESGGEKEKVGGETRTVIASVLARMFITPLVLYPFLLVMAVFTPLKIFRDPIFILAMVLLIGGPTAVTMAQLTSAASSHFERLVSRVIFWSYIVCLTPLTILGALLAILISKVPPHA